MSPSLKPRPLFFAAPTICFARSSPFRISGSPGIRNRLNSRAPQLPVAERPRVLAVFFIVAAQNTTRPNHIFHARNSDGLRAGSKSLTLHSWRFFENPKYYVIHNHPLRDPETREAPAILADASFESRVVLRWAEAYCADRKASPSNVISDAAYLTCLVSQACPVWLACPALTAAGVLAAVSVLSFAAAVRVFVRAVGVAAAVFAQFGAVFPRPAAVAFGRRSAAAAHRNFSARFAAAREPVAARFSGVPGPVSCANLRVVVGVSDRVADSNCRRCLAAMRGADLSWNFPDSNFDSPECWTADSNCPAWCQPGCLDSAHLAGLTDSAGWRFPAADDSNCFAVASSPADSNCLLLRPVGWPVRSAEAAAGREAQFERLHSRRRSRARSPELPVVPAGSERSRAAGRHFHARSLAAWRTAPGPAAEQFWPQPADSE